MDKDDWWRMLRCAGDAQEKTAVDNLMLQYRPIAPKPVTGQPCLDSNTSYLANRRTKRKYVSVSKDDRKRKNRSNSSVQENEQDAVKKVVTLQLLPEKTDNLDQKEESTPSNSDNLDRTVDTMIIDNQEPPTWIRLNGCSMADQTVRMLQTKMVESWVTVESVTDAVCGIRGGSHALGCTGVVIIEKLGKDTCPGFVSDGSNRVMWLNEAYKRMVTGCDAEESRESSVVVWLVVNETVTFNLYKAFTCRVRLEYTWQNTKYTKTVPCDVWKIDFGGYAWRLDTEAALSLGVSRH